MITVFRYMFARFRGQILGWGIGLALYNMYLVSFWDTLAANREQFQSLIEAYPKEMMAFFGDMATMFTPAGYLNIYFFFYMSLIIGIYALLAGSGLLAGDEENGQLDLVLSYPISRTAFFVGRLLAFVVATVGILALSWLGFVIAMTWSTLDVGWAKLSLPMLSLLAILLLFGNLALLLSMVVPSRRLAAMITAILLVAGYLITSLARIDEDLKSVAQLSPFNYYQGGEAVNGLNMTWFVGLMVAATIFAVLAWWLFLRREIRVGGEGSWQWGLPWHRGRRVPVRQRGAQAET